MNHWQILDAWLKTNRIRYFRSVDLAQSLGISGSEASQLIQAFLTMQTDHWPPPTNRVLSRRGRTVSAVWHVGNRLIDANGFADQGHDDMRNRWDRFILPSLAKITITNPQPAVINRVQTLETVFDSNLTQLERLIA